MPGAAHERSGTGGRRLLRRPAVRGACDAQNTSGASFLQPFRRSWSSHLDLEPCSLSERFDRVWVVLEGEPIGDHGIAVDHAPAQECESAFEAPVDGHRTDDLDLV